MSVSCVVLCCVVLCCVVLCCVVLCCVVLCCVVLCCVVLCCVVLCCVVLCCVLLCCVVLCCVVLCCVVLCCVVLCCVVSSAHTHTHTHAPHIQDELCSLGLLGQGDAQPSLALHPHKRQYLQPDFPVAYLEILTTLIVLCCDLLCWSVGNTFKGEPGGVAWFIPNCIDTQPLEQSGSVAYSAGSQPAGPGALCKGLAIPIAGPVHSAQRQSYPAGPLALRVQRLGHN